MIQIEFPAWFDILAEISRLNQAKKKCTVTEISYYTRHSISWVNKESHGLVNSGLIDMETKGRGTNNFIKITGKGEEALNKIFEIKEKNKELTILIRG